MSEQAGINAGKRTINLAKQIDKVEAATKQGEELTAQLA